jgi:ribosome maturation factor RimP
MIDKEHIKKVVEEVTAESGFFLVDIHVSKGNLIQVYLDHMNGIGLDDCALFSKKIEESLNRDSEDFELQVSSPGLGQPLKVLQQYYKSVGEKIDIQLKSGDQFKGVLEAVNNREGGNGHILVVKLAGTKKKPAPAEPVLIDLEEVKIAKVEIDFNKL